MQRNTWTIYREEDKDLHWSHGGRICKATCCFHTLSPLSSKVQHQGWLSFLLKDVTGLWWKQKGGKYIFFLKKEKQTKKLVWSGILDPQCNSVKVATSTPLPGLSAHFRHPIIPLPANNISFVINVSTVFIIKDGTPTGWKLLWK